MREFSTQIAQALLSGLKPSEQIRDDSFLLDLYNLVPHENSLRPYKPVHGSVQLDENTEYPFPQWFNFESEDIVVTQNGVYRADKSYIPFELKSVNLGAFEFNEFTEPFHAVDYGDNWLLISPEGCIYKYDGVIKSTTKFRANSVLQHKNRTLIAGAYNGFWTDEWKAKLNELKRTSQLNTDLFSFHLSENFIFWSDFDSAYFPFSLLEPSLLDPQTFLDLLYSNSFGYMESPYGGSILSLIESNDQVFALGDEGIFSITMNQQATGATYTITGKQPFGVKSRQATGGDSSSFIFIDSENQLWAVDGQGLQKLDFSFYMRLLQDNMYVVKDFDEQLFYIGDKYNSYVLNNGRLTRVFQTVGTTHELNGVKAGVTFETGDRKARISTDKLDIGIPSLKTLTGVNIGTDEIVKGHIRGVAHVNGKEIKSKNVIINQEGYAACRIYGKNHRTTIILEKYDNVHLDFIELKWQIDDRRQTRGVFATQGSSGTSE